MKEMKAPEKVTQKMTHDGAVTENHVTGEVEWITSREAEMDYSSSEEPVATGEAAVEAVVHTGKRHSEKEQAKAEKQTVRNGNAVRQRPSSRLQFTEEELADPDLQPYIRRSNQAADKLDTAKDAIPKKKVLKTERVYEEVSGKSKTHFRFGEVEKKSNGKLRQNPLSRPMQEISMATHNQVRKVEHENVGVEAGHKGEELAEQVVGYSAHKARSAYQNHRLKPWRDVSNAEQEAVRANADFLYQKALHDDPSLAASNPVSRYLQKQRIRRNYAKQLWQTEKTARETAATTQSTTQRAKEAVRETFLYVKKHRRGVLLVIGFSAVLMMPIGGVSSCSTMVGSGLGSVLTSSYLSEDSDMLAAEAAYSAMEAELQNYLDTYESTHDYDEYIFDLDEIGHDPYVLISILSALHDGIFTISDVQDDLEMLFEKQYILTETVTEETRYRTETMTGERPKRDPDTGEFVLDKDGWQVMEEYEYEEEVPYTYYICTVTLENFDLSHVPVYIMSEEELSMYATYMSTLGNREDLFEGVAGASTLKEPTYYEIPPEALEDEVFAAMITEAEKYLGYPYVWGGSSPSTSFDCSGFVSWVINHSGWNVGRLGAQGLYNIGTPVTSSQAKPGDLVFFVGTYDTPGVSHVGIYVGNGMMIHCGDPISYANLNTSYWQSHFYSFGRLP